MGHSVGIAYFNQSDTYRFFEYDDTVDIAYPGLFKTFEELDKSWRKQEKPKQALLQNIDFKNSLEEVEFFSSYGSGFTWSGIASPMYNIIRTGLNPFDMDDESGIYKNKYSDYIPEWVKQFLVKETEYPEIDIDKVEAHINPNKTGLFD